MMKTIDIAGIRLENYTVREAIMELERDMEEPGFHTVEEVNTDTLMLADTDEAVRVALMTLEHTVISETGILEAVGALTYQRRHEIEHHDFFFELMRRMARNHKAVYLIGDTAERTETVRAWIGEYCSGCIIAGDVAVEAWDKAADAIVNEINAAAPDVILSILPSPAQEHFLLENKDKLSASLWYGIGTMEPMRRQKGIRSFGSISVCTSWKSTFTNTVMGRKVYSMKLLKKYQIWNYLLIFAGTGIMALAIAGIYDQIGLITGGFSGIAIIVKNVTQPLVKGGIPLWLTNLVLNVPVFLCGYLKFGKKFVGKTLFGTVMLSAWLYVIPPIDLAQGDYLLAALFGGVFTGAGFGLVLRAGATTGGTDMVAALIQPRMRHHSVSQIMQVIDGMIVLLGLYVFGMRPTLYAVVAIYVTTQVADSLLEGLKSSKAAFIITNHYEEVARRLMTGLDRGVTGLDARGMYTHEQRCVLYCVVSRKEIVQVKEIVNEIDPDAFVIVSDVREVLGEGFLEYSHEL